MLECVHAEVGINVYAVILGSDAKESSASFIICLLIFELSHASQSASFSQLYRRATIEGFLTLLICSALMNPGNVRAYDLSFSNTG